MCFLLKSKIEIEWASRIRLLNVFFNEKTQTTQQQKITLSSSIANWSYLKKQMLICEKRKGNSRIWYSEGKKGKRSKAWKLWSREEEWYFKQSCAVLFEICGITLAIAWHITVHLQHFSFFSTIFSQLWLFEFQTIWCKVREMEGEVTGSKRSKWQHLGENNTQVTPVFEPLCLVILFWSWGIMLPDLFCYNLLTQ